MISIISIIPIINKNLLFVLVVGGFTYLQLINIPLGR